MKTTLEDQEPFRAAPGLTSQEAAQSTAVELSKLARRFLWRVPAPTP